VRAASSSSCAAVPSDHGPEAAFRLETIDIDLPPLVAALSERLRDAGLPVTPAHATDSARALALVAPITRRRLYWTMRAVFVSDQAQLKAFDAVFFAVFAQRLDAEDFEAQDAQTAAAPPDERPSTDHHSSPRDPSEQAPRRVPSTSAPRDRESGEQAEDEIELPVAIAHDEEVLASKSFDALSPEELTQLYRLMSRLELATPLRRTRRSEAARHGERIDLRRTLRASLRSGGDPIRLARRRRRTARRRLVMLCDISGSMEPYARAYLQFLTCAAGSGPNAEAFVFATRLTRLTRALALRNPERAIQRAAAAAPDWSSGTRIGDALRAFNDRHGRRGMARGAVVVIISDGWERGDPMLVGREMERLSRLAHRIVWVNPRLSARDFTAQTGGMLAALPYCDAIVSGHSYEALGEVVEAIRQCAAAPPVSRLRSADGADDDLQEPWGSATPVAGSSVAMPSGHGPSRGNTTSGWVTDEPA
jgi:uncharacterized protein with von Willebrand factor type A (vWA) domain